MTSHFCRVRQLVQADNRGLPTLLSKTDLAKSSNKYPLATNVILTSLKAVLNQHSGRVHALNKHPLRIGGS
ncbi:hypothetical protein J6590_048213 [Homalodisca vitripennis]|nr:hypothetical protein J6590_048213 [Homalodisca vitripennis]